MKVPPLTRQITKKKIWTLDEQNETCRTLVNQRNEERSYTDSQAMQKARKATDAAYADFVVMLNAYNVVSIGTSNGYYEEAISVINADIDYYKQWVLRKNGGSADDVMPDDDDPSDDGGSDGGGSDDGGSDTKPDGGDSGEDGKSE